MRRPATRCWRRSASPSLDALIDQTIPPDIRLTAPLDLPAGDSEQAYLRRLRGIAARNRTFRSFIGHGYYDCVTPAVILRNVLENPGWYTPYTPYQAEIAQGRLESLLNFQTVVKDLTGMDIATASLLDEGTAAAEAMTMFHRLQTKKAPAGQESVFVVSDRCFAPDHRRAARPGRTAADPAGDRRRSRDSAGRDRQGLRRARAVSGRPRRGLGSPAVDRAGARRRGAGGGGDATCSRWRC